MSQLFVINLGLPKTGTTTLGRALRRASMNVADWKIRPNQTKRPEIVQHLVGELLYRGWFDTGDPLDAFGEFDAITEMSVARPGHNFWPQTDWGLLSAIADTHPNVRFLLSARDPGKTANSMMRWGTLGNKRLPQQDVPGLPRGFGVTEAELARWVAGHHAFCRRVFSGCDRFLEFDIADDQARQKISDFLGINLPWWGRSNKNVADHPDLPASDAPRTSPDQALTE